MSAGQSTRPRPVEGSLLKQGDVRICSSLCLPYVLTGVSKPYPVVKYFSSYSCLYVLLTLKPHYPLLFPQHNSTHITPREGGKQVCLCCQLPNSKGENPKAHYHLSVPLPVREQCTVCFTAAHLWGSLTPNGAYSEQNHQGATFPHCGPRQQFSNPYLFLLFCFFPLRFGILPIPWEFN